MKENTQKSYKIYVEDFCDQDHIIRPGEENYTPLGPWLQSLSGLHFFFVYARLCNGPMDFLHFFLVYL